MIDEQGWVKIHRKLLKWEWYDDINTKVVFLHLLLTVNYEAGRWQGRTIERGQRVTSLRKLAKEVRLTIDELRTALNHLKTTHEITQQSHANYSLLTVTKYNDYQQIPTQNPKRIPHESHIYKNIRNKEDKNKETMNTIEDGEASSPTPKKKMEDFIFSVKNNTQEATDLVTRISVAKKIPPASALARFTSSVIPRIDFGTRNIAIISSREYWRCSTICMSI